MYCDTIALKNCSMTVYIPDLVADPAVRRPTIVIAPGGGYTHLSTREGEPIALTFAAMGMNAVVVRYRVAPAVFPAPMQDIASAVAAIRQNADNWHADPNQIALCGFSAGAHAVGLLGVHWQEAHWWQEMHLTSADVRPNALILSYPVITAGEFAHRGSFRSLTGTDDIAAHQPHSLENLVTPDTPPTFLRCVVAVINDRSFVASLFNGIHICRVYLVEVGFCEAVINIHSAVIINKHACIIINAVIACVRRVILILRKELERTFGLIGHANNAL